MEGNLCFLIPLVLILTLFQSVFGVGLLLFGTPTLLAVGIPFFEVLSIILPPSLSISVQQVIRNKQLIQLSYNVTLIIFFALFAGLSIAVFLIQNSQVELLIGLVLIIISITRFREERFRTLKYKIINHERMAFFLVSLIHGVTNMGGGFLTYIMSSKYKSKEKISANIATIYAIYASFQIMALISFERFTFDINALILTFISASTYYLIGNFLINKINDNYFRNAITFIILIYGFVSILSSTS